MSESPTIEAVKRALDATHADGAVYLLKQGEHTILGYGGDVSSITREDWFDLLSYIVAVKPE